MISIESLFEGNRRTLAKAITLVESKQADHRKQANELIEKSLPHAGKSIRIAISGTPGAGKSTLIEHFGLFLIEKGKRVAVLAIDPSSQISGGSLMGDKTRMEKLAICTNAFVRPTPSSGTLGGIARNTYESLILCEAAGFDVVLIETVGIGQSETMARDISDYFIFLQLAGAGDELQGMKRGIMEMADMIFINKADTTSKDKIKRTLTDLKSALHFFPLRFSGLEVDLLSGSGLSGEGLEEIWRAVLDYEEKTKATGFFNESRKKQALKRFQELWQLNLIDRLKKDKHFLSEFSRLSKELEEQKISPYEAVNILSGKLKWKF